MKLLGIALGMFLSIFILSSCSKSDNGNNQDNNNLNRKTMLENYANNYILPAYADISGKLNEMKTATDAFISSPSETNLKSLQLAWRNAYTTWQKVEMLEFGPAEDASLRTFMNIYPVSITKISSNISSGTYNLDAFGSSDVQGFPALDYLLNGLVSDPAGVVSFYTTDPQASSRKKYLEDVVNKMIEKVQTVGTAWNTYKNTFIEKTGTDVNSSLSKMVNAYVLYFERYLRAGKIGLPAGAMTGTAMPQLSEAYYTPELSNELAKTALAAVINYYEGKSYTGVDGIGMKEYFAAIGTKENDKLIADIISDEMNEAVLALNNLNMPVKEAVITNRATVLGIYDQLQDLVPLLKVDMVSAFGISITYVDNDGD